MDDLPSPGSGAKRKRPLFAARCRSPIERLQQECEDEQGDDLDCFRQHKRYITEVGGRAGRRRGRGAGSRNVAASYSLCAVRNLLHHYNHNIPSLCLQVMSNGLSSALSLSGSPSPQRQRSGGDMMVDADGCAPVPWQQAGGLLEATTPQQQAAWEQQQQQQPGSFPASLQWPPRRPQPLTVAAASTSACTALEACTQCTVDPMQEQHQQQQQPQRQGHNNHQQQQQQQAGMHAAGGGAVEAPPPPAAAAQSAAADGSSSACRVDLRKVTLLRSLLHKTEEHLKLQGALACMEQQQQQYEGAGGSPTNTISSGRREGGYSAAAAGDMEQQPFRAVGNGLSSWQHLAAPHLSSVPLWHTNSCPMQQQQQQQALHQVQQNCPMSMVRCSTPISSDGSMGGCGGGDGTSTPSPSSTPSGGGGGGGSVGLGGRMACIEQQLREDSGNEAGNGAAHPRQTSQQQQLSSWLPPFRQLSVQRPPLPSPHRQQLQPASPEITRERLERLRAKALLAAAAAHADLRDGQCRSSRRTTADAAAQNCGETWQLAAFRGAAGERAGSAASRRHSSHL